jgi:hypothetical protein
MRRDIQSSCLLKTLFREKHPGGEFAKLGNGLRSKPALAKDDTRHFRGHSTVAQRGHRLHNVFLRVERREAIEQRQRLAREQ